MDCGRKVGFDRGMRELLKVNSRSNSGKVRVAKPEIRGKEKGTTREWLTMSKRTLNSILWVSINTSASVLHSPVHLTCLHKLIP
jgi:hypothetical protein